MMLTVENLHKSYQVGKTTYEVLKGISLTVDQGEFVAVMRPLGFGKATGRSAISHNAIVSQESLRKSSFCFMDFSSSLHSEKRFLCYTGDHTERTLIQQRER